MSKAKKFLVLAAVMALAGCAQPGSELDQPLAGQAGTVAPAKPNAPPVVVKLERPSWKVGDQWRYSDEYALRVTEVGGNLAKFQRVDAPGQWFVANGLMRDKTQSATTLRQVIFRSENPDLLYQAKVGEPLVFVREYLREKQLIRHQTSWVIEGYERITVPAGTFDTVIVTMRTRSLTGNWTGFERWWYSPQVRNYVRMEYKYGQAPDNARVLLSYQVN